MLNNNWTVHLNTFWSAIETKTFRGAARNKNVKMDTINRQLKSTSSTSETHSDKTASDEEELKSNIPYYHDDDDDADAKSSVASLHPQSYESLDHKLEADDTDDPNSINYSNWDIDDGYINDNISRTDSEYSLYSPYIETNAFYGGTTTAKANICMTKDYSNDTNIEMKQSPNESGYICTTPSSTPQNYYAQPSLLPQQQIQKKKQMNEQQQQQQQQQHSNHQHPQPQPQPQPSSHPQRPLQQQRPPSSPPHTYTHHHHHLHHHNPAYTHDGNSHPRYNPYNQQIPQNYQASMCPRKFAGYLGPYFPNIYTHEHHGYAQHETAMMDMLQLSNSGREARNRAEKNRRDKLNGSIQELSTMVPHVAESPRRVDKTAVLRFAAHGLRLQHVFGSTINQSRPKITDEFMKLIDGFFLTLTCHGHIILISSSIEQHLGHCQADLYGQNIINITHPDDHGVLKQQLIPNDLENLFDIQPDDGSGEPRQRTPEEEELIDRKLLADKRCFTIRLARAGPRSEPTTYEVVRIDGCFRRSDAAPRGVKTSNVMNSLQLIRRTRGRDDTIPLHTISGNDITLIAIARIIKPPKIINRVTDANRLEYKTRHLIDGQIVDCDMRIGIVAGYMTDEVRNLSPFMFMHQDDVRWVIVALRQMYDANSSYGESTYRLLTRNGNFIYLQSKGYLEIDKSSNRVHSFLCINTLLDEEEGKRRIQEMKNKFSTIINATITQTSVDVPASENPQQLEKEIFCLIQNLNKASSDEEEDNDSTVHIEELQPTSPKSITHGHGAHHEPRQTSTTPVLALVPPEADIIKSSISKSVCVVNVTAGKHLRDNTHTQSPIRPDDTCEEHYDYNLNSMSVNCASQLKGKNCEHYFEKSTEQLSPISIGTKRRLSSASSNDNNEQLLKRRPKSPTSP